MATLRFVVTLPAQDDVDAIVGWSRNRFGQNAALRYEVLIRQALSDLRADPRRLGASQRKSLGGNVWLYHLKSSRDRVAGTRVTTPRHFIAYRIKPPVVLVLRVLHDRRDLGRHIPD